MDRGDNDESAVFFLPQGLDDDGDDDLPSPQSQTSLEDAKRPLISAKPLASAVAFGVHPVHVFPRLSTTNDSVSSGAMPSAAASFGGGGGFVSALAPVSVSAFHSSASSSALGASAGLAPSRSNESASGSQSPSFAPSAAGPIVPAALRGVNPRAATFVPQFTAQPVRTRTGASSDHNATATGGNMSTSSLAPGPTNRGLRPSSASSIAGTPTASFASVVSPLPSASLASPQTQSFAATILKSFSRQASDPPVSATRNSLPASDPSSRSSLSTSGSEFSAAGASAGAGLVSGGRSSSTNSAFKYPQYKTALTASAGGVQLPTLVKRVDVSAQQGTALRPIFFITNV